MTLEHNQELKTQSRAWLKALQAVAERIADGGPADATIQAVLDIIKNRTSLLDAGIFVDLDRMYGGAMLHAQTRGPGSNFARTIAKLSVPLRLVRSVDGQHPIWSDIPSEIVRLEALPLAAEGQQHGVLWLAATEETFEEDDLFHGFVQTLRYNLASLLGTAAAFDHARKRREWLSAILASTPDPVLVIDQERCLQLANLAAHDVFPGLDDTGLGRPLAELNLPADLIDLDRDTDQEDIPLVDHTAENGHTYSPRVSFVQTDDGRMSGWVVILRDMTHFKRLNDSMSDFLSTVSHDMRSPLTFMKGYLDMLGMIGPLNERQIDFVEKIASGFDQMSDMVEKILEAGRLDPMTGNYQLQRELSDITEIIDKIVLRFKEPAAKKGLEFTHHVQEDIPVLNVDREMVSSAFTNLVENAIKYTPENGGVAVQLSAQDDELLFAVRDTGLGISEADQKKLFQRNVRIRRKEWKRVKGNGLGLFIVKNVAQRHGGDAWVESVEGEGSTFYLSIPLEGPNLATSRTVSDERASASP